MPYYQEIYLDGVEEASFRGLYKPTGNVSPDYRSIAPAKVDKLTTYRSFASKKALLVKEVPEHVADPYGYFLTSARDHKWEQALQARGLDITSMEPDRGHAFKSERWQRSRGISFTETYQVNTVYSFSNVWTSPMRFAYAGSTADATAKLLWSRAAPRSEVFDAAVFAGELREGLPRLVPELLKGKANFLKSVGSDYLNVQFGWKPFLTELQNAARALVDATSWVTKPIGPIHRTRGTKVDIAPVSLAYPSGLQVAPSWGYLPSFITASEARDIYRELGYDSATSGGGGINQSFTGNIVHLQERKSWFEGNFFLLPKVGFDPNNFYDRLTALMDVNITPSTLWELAPWSWLIDWFSHVGDSLTLAEQLADDRVHAQYAYGMETYRSFSYFDGKFSFRNNGYVHSGSTFQDGASELYVRKERVRANPFGFIAGGNAALNESQNAILLALGLTKIGR